VHPHDDPLDPLLDELDDDDDDDESQQQPTMNLYASRSLRRNFSGSASNVNAPQPEQ